MNLIPRREKCSSKKSTIRTFISSIRKGLPMVFEIETHHGFARVHWEHVKPGASEKSTGDDFVKIKDGRITEVYVIVNGQTEQAESSMRIR
jgi:hypothetical protein